MDIGCIRALGRPRHFNYGVSPSDRGQSVATWSEDSDECQNIVYISIVIYCIFPPEKQYSNSNSNKRCLQAAVNLLGFSPREFTLPFYYYYMILKSDPALKVKIFGA